MSSVVAVAHGGLSAYPSAASCLLCPRLPGLAIRLDPQLVAAALARNDRYVREVVEALNVCPYAAQARRAGRTERRVMPWSEPVEALALHADHLAMMRRMAMEDDVEVVQWIYPTVPWSADVWDRAAKDLTMRCHQALGVSVVGVAPLHPEAAYRTTSPAALVPLFRRTPDPTIQWIALRALEAVRRGRPNGEVLLPRDPEEAAALLDRLSKPSVADAVARGNAALAASMGVAELEALFASLRDDEPHSL